MWLHYLYLFKCLFIKYWLFKYLNIIIRCKQDILYTFVTLFLIWKQKKYILLNFKPLLTFQNKWIFKFFSWASLASFLFLKTICVISFGLEKIPQKYPQQLCHFLGVGDDHNPCNLWKLILEPQGWKSTLLPPSHPTCDKIIMCILFKIFHLKHCTKHHFLSLISY
jgi:hypothetical protein